MTFYNTCDTCGYRYHVGNAYGCPRCNNPLLIQIGLIDEEIKRLRERRARLAQAYDNEQKVTA